MVGDSKRLGKPAQSTRLDLTLGEDADGDGIPDAWERALISALGGNATLADINASGDLDGDGHSNLDEYLAGTYAFDPHDGFSLKLAMDKSGRPIIEFLAIRGRSYSIETSSDLKTWTPVSFRLITDASTETARTFYQAQQLHFCIVEPSLPEGMTADRLYFRAKVQ